MTMLKSLLAGAALLLVAAPGAAGAQEGAALDCVVQATDADLKASIGNAMTGAGDDASREALFKQLAAVVDGCIGRHGIADAQKGDYFDYSLARISREWLIGELARSKLSNLPVDKVLDFGPDGANPDLSADMTDDQIGAIVQAYTDAGIDIETIDQTVWEKVGAYAAATSIYWNKRKALPF
jgi:hypothetical protein